jgi:catechol 2,3-dioxygenase-like lactoylglutathione lyase family enzyme
MDRIIAHIHLMTHQMNMEWGNHQAQWRLKSRQRRSPMSVTARLDHVAIPAQHPKDLATYYQALLGLEQTLEGNLPNLGDFVFLGNGEARQSQILALITRPEAKHIAWRVESLAALKAFYANAKARGIPISFALNHRVTLSLYLRDPEGNAVEVFWPTGQNVEGMYAEPFDLALLEQPDAVLLGLVNGSALA